MNDHRREQQGLVNEFIFHQQFQEARGSGRRSKTLLTAVAGASFLAGLIVGVAYAFFLSDWAEQKRQHREALEKRARIPKIVSQVDGCKVYGFTADGRQHFFTRCPASKTVTETNWDKCSGTGKTRRCEPMSDKIEDNSQ